MNWMDKDLLEVLETTRRENWELRVFVLLLLVTNALALIAFYLRS